MDSIFVATEQVKGWIGEWITAMVVHEGAHLVGPESKPERVVDHGYRHRPNFFKLGPHAAIRSADCYAHFAGEARVGREVIAKTVTVTVGI